MRFATASGRHARGEGDATVADDYRGLAMTIRVVQWTTGNVGKRSVRAVVARP